MASTYSSRLRLELIGTGDQSGSWGTTLNLQLGTLIEQAIAGCSVITIPTNADYTLTVSNGASDQARNAILQVVSAVALTTTRAVIVPAVSKTYVVANGTTGGQGILVKPAAGTGIIVPSGASQLLYCDGVNVNAAGLPWGSNAAIQSGNLIVAGTFSVSAASSFSGAATFGSTVTLAGKPSAALQAATKDYVDDGFLSLTGGTVRGPFGTELPSAPTTGAIFLGNSGTKYLQFDGTRYLLPGAPLLVNGSQVLTAATGAGNGVFLPLTGGTMTGNLLTSTAASVIAQGGNLYVRANSGNRHLWFQDLDGNGGGVVWNDTATNTMRIRVGLAPEVAINASGDVVAAGRVECQSPRGIGGTGRAMVDSLSRFGPWAWNGSQIQVDIDGQLRGITVSVSDLRLKTDVTPTRDSALDKICDLDFIDFRYLPLPGDPEDFKPRLLHGGVAAQQAQRIDPGWVDVMPDAMGTLQLNAPILLTNALQAIKQLRGSLDAAKARIAALEIAVGASASA